MNYEPWARPHDVDGAGLRDYRPRPPAPRRIRSTAWLIAIAFLLGVLAGATLRASAPDRSPVVSLRVRPQVMLQRGDVRVEVRVPRHADNRLLSIAWSSDYGTAGTTLRQLDGDDAAVLHTLNLPSQPPANYVFVAAVFGPAGALRGRDDARIVVPDDGTSLDASRTNAASPAGLRNDAPATRRTPSPETRTR